MPKQDINQGSAPECECALLLTKNRRHTVLEGNMLMLKDFLKQCGKPWAAMLLGLMLAGCGSGGGSDNIICGGDCSPPDPNAPTGTPAGVPAADKFSLSVSDFAPANAFNTDGIEVTFSVIVSDQFGNPVVDGSTVHFKSPESGQIQETCTIAGGGCFVIWRSSDPRPPNGRLSVLAYMEGGSEAFNDVNGNFIFDGNETFTDLGEACLDENENGICEADLFEFFVDANNNSVIDAGDGVWNGPCFSNIDSAAICNTPASTVIF